MHVHQRGAEAPAPVTPELTHQDHVDLAPLSTAAAHAVVTPTSEKAPDAANVGGPVQTETQCLTLEQPADDGKPFATLRAQLALKGHGLSRTHVADGPVRFYVTRWGLVRELRDFAAVREFAEQVGVQL